MRSEMSDRLMASLSEDGRYRLLVESVTDYAIYMLDPDGIVSSWNPGAQRFKGYEPSEIIGRHFSCFYTEEDRRDGLPERALATAAREGRFESEGWRVRKDGTRFWTGVVIDPIRTPSGLLIGFAKVTRDLTERKQAQEALEQAREALFQSQKMEAIGQLTGGIAHDFNNLLSAVLGSLELLRKRMPDDPRLVRLLDNAVQAAQRGTSLTQRMLSFARRQELKPEPVDLPALVAGMSELLRTSLGPSVTVEMRFPPALKPVLADSNQLELALLNLAVNARDAMPKGGPLVISAREDRLPPDQCNLRPGLFVCLSVIDRGVGMDEATLAKAMDPFFTTKGVGKGTGLGLSMVHGMAEQSGGCLVLTSREGEGTTAELWLPIAPSAGDRSRQEHLAGTAGARGRGTPAADPRRRRRCPGADEHRRHAGGIRPRGLRGDVRPSGAGYPEAGGGRSRHHGSGDAADDRDATCRSGQGRSAAAAGHHRDGLRRTAANRGTRPCPARQAVHATEPR